LAARLLGTADDRSREQVGELRHPPPLGVFYGSRRSVGWRTAGDVRPSDRVLGLPAQFRRANGGAALDELARSGAAVFRGDVNDAYLEVHGEVIIQIDREWLAFQPPSLGMTI
jgi:hypothetical protein